MVVSESILITIVIVVFIWLIGLTVAYVGHMRFLRHVTKDISKHDLQSILKTIAKSLKTIGNRLTASDNKILDLEKNAQHYFQTMSLIRYNPFQDTGGNQSFCLCLLDHHHTGLIITSLHSREQTRMYAKKILKGVSADGPLSKEEEQALKEAIKGA